MAKLGAQDGPRWPLVSRQAKDEATLARLAAIVENSPDAILVIDLEGIVTDWNRGAERLYGFDALEMIGRSVSVVVPLEAGPELDDILVTVRGGDVIGPYDTVRLRKDGAIVHVSMTASPITDAQGGVSGISWIARDLTERLQVTEALRASEAQLTALYDHNPASIVLSERATGRVLRVNATFERVLGCSREEAVGRTMAELGMVEGPPEREGAAGHPRREASYTNRELTVRSKGGGLVSLLASAEVLEVGGTECVIDAAVDITARRAAEDALREADHRKDEFLAMLSHELRNPMAAISAAVQYLGRRGLGDPKLEQAREVAERQVRHMARLLDDLLDVERITSGALSLRTQTFALNEPVETAVAATRPSLDAKSQVLSVSLPDEPLSVTGDPTRVVQVISNLLDNAAKFSPAGGQNHLSVVREGSEAVLRVRDHGVGIAPTLLPRVFDLFVQDERGPGRREGGLGIGLTTVRRLVQLHEGRVEAHSEGPGLGSEFTVWLPLPPAPAPPGHAAAGEPGPAPGPHRVLIVDDVADAAEMLALVVGREGHEVRVALSGLDALDAAATFQPDVVLLDLGMPEMDGYEVARRLRALPAGRQPVLVAVTGYGQEEDRGRTRAAGFDHHLVKPVDPEQLRRLLGQAGRAA